MNENFGILTKISMKIVHKGAVNIISELVQVIAWRQTGDKPLFETILTNFNDTICCH